MPLILSISATPFQKVSCKHQPYTKRPESTFRSCLIGDNYHYKKILSRFFRLWNYFGLDNCFLCAAVLCTVGCLSAPLASISKVRITPTSNFDNKNTSPDLTECLWVFLNHLWLRTTRTGIFRHNTSYFREKHLFSLPELSYSILSHHLSVYLFPSCILKKILRVYF